MSVDNVIAVAGAAHGSIALVVFGIAVSIPIVVWGSKLVLALMDRFPIVITAGGALLGWIGGGMLLTDPALPAAWREIVPHSPYIASGVGALLVVAVGKWLASHRNDRANDATPAGGRSPIMQSGDPTK
jgi:predicted tellurium resistance membrane protein TerC